MPKRLFGITRLTPREKAALQAGIPIEAIGQNKQIARKLKKTKPLQRGFLAWSGRTTKDRAGWNQRRLYSDYNALFGPYLGRLETFLSNMAKRKKRPLRVTDDGAGYGYFLSSIKQKLSRAGVQTVTTAIVRRADSKEIVFRNEGLDENEKIDEIYRGNAETYLPKEKQDAVFSLFGSPEYSMKEFKKQILLKYAYSLNRGGVAAIGIGSPRTDVTPSIQDVQRAASYLTKIGFEAKWHRVPDFQERKLPEFVLIIRRP